MLTITPDHRSGAMAQRHHSIGDYDQMRSHAGSNLQSFYANQRYQPRPNEAEQMVQAKRRMAAQRERELRNYHQEQQYNRSACFFPSNLKHCFLTLIFLQISLRKANLIERSAPMR